MAYHLIAKHLLHILRRAHTHTWTPTQAHVQTSNHQKLTIIQIQDANLANILGFATLLACLRLFISSHATGAPPEDCERPFTNFASLAKLLSTKCIMKKWKQCRWLVSRRDNYICTEHRENRNYLWILTYGLSPKHVSHTIGNALSSQPGNNKTKQIINNNKNEGLCTLGRSKTILHGIVWHQVGNLFYLPCSPPIYSACHDHFVSPLEPWNSQNLGSPVRRPAGRRTFDYKPPLILKWP